MNSRKSESVDRSNVGVVLVAKNTQEIDYLRIAELAAKLITKNLQLPVTIIEPTDNQVNQKLTESTPQEWRNFGRWQVYDQSPYDTTILLDSDYLTLTPLLTQLHSTIHDYRVLRTNNTPTGKMNSPMGKFANRHLWATMVMFQKTAKTQLLFEMVERVERNRRYYQQLFKLPHGSFRNDFAFTIADLVINGYQLEQSSLPITALTITDPIKSIKRINRLINIKTDRHNIVIPEQDLHIMDKRYLLTTEFEEFVNE